ncbi:MAG TPA: DUF1501 domain-containing protein [Gemmataceae bacterium]|nr:DUF1501 domain-containing protein [Gemmataceae bacterium]
MLSIFGNGRVRHCQGVSRREFLRVGSLALGGLSLPGLLAARARAEAARKVFQDKSVVLLCLVGGPPQIETFDPKKDVPENNRSCTGEVQTKLPGVSFGGTFPKMAALADRLAIVRSFGSGDGGHNQLPILTGNNRLKSPMGALVARALGSMNPRTGVPTNNVLVPESIQPDLKLENPTGPFTYDYVLKNYVPAGGVGSSCEAFLPAGGATLLNNLQMRLPRERFDDRRRLLGELDSLKRRLDRMGELEALDGFQQQAYEVLLKGVVGAFDLSKENPKTVAKYDTSHLFNMDDYHKGGKHYNRLVNQSRVSNLLGKQMLLARRLCEAGAGFVTVLDSCWDFHADGNNPGVPAGMAFLGPQLDHAVAAFLEDVQERGLSDKILLIITGEMGRSPTKGKNGGTGHHADLTPLVLAGGGLKMGQVIGLSDKQGRKPATEPYRPPHLLATVLHTLFNAGEVRINPSSVPGAVAELVNKGQPIAELF